MTYLGITIQILLFLVFAVGGTIRFFQPIDVLAKRMLWVKYFDPRMVRAISMIEVICGIGIILPLVFSDSTFSFFTLFWMLANGNYGRSCNHPCYHW